MGGDAGLNSHGGGGSVQGGWGAVGAERCRCDRRCDDLHSFRPGGVSPTRTRHAAPRRQDARDERVGRPTMRTGSVCVCVCVCVLVCVWCGHHNSLPSLNVRTTHSISLSLALSLSLVACSVKLVCVSLSLFLEQQHCAELATQRERNCSIHLFFFFLLLLFLLLLHLLLVLFLVFILQDYHARTFDGQSRGTTLEQLL